MLDVIGNSESQNKNDKYAILTRTCENCSIMM